MDNPDDTDRAAILARRRRFILMAIGGLGCQPPSAPTSPETVVLELVPDESAQTQSPVPEPDSISDEQLGAVLADPALDFCVRNPLAGAMLTEDQKEQLAKAMFTRAERAEAEGDLACALAVMEQAFFYKPGAHGFALRIGELAAAAQQWQKASEYLRHYVTYADPEKRAVEIERAKQLLEIPEIQAHEPPPTTWDGDPYECRMPGRSLEAESPPSPVETKRERRQRERVERWAKREQERAAKAFRPRKRR